MKQAIDLNDVQGLILSGYGKKPAARYALFQVVEPAAACAWLGRLVEHLQFGNFRGSPRREPPYLGDLCANLAFTHAGFRQLGLNETALAGFSLPFQEGMCE